VIKLPEAQHILRMEFFGYHRWGDNYNDLTQEQALFLDLGLSELYSKMFGGEDKENNSSTTRNTFNKHGRRRWHID